ncbi:transcription factor [Podila clonocystis]|nr:transcription factor [Podila clonocystis]
MELLKENQPPILREAEWKDENLGGLDLLLKAAQKSVPVATKKSKVPSMTLVGSYQAPVIVGRGSQATLNLGKVNKQVSRRHAIVEWCRDSGSFQITVLGQNGVRINGTGFPSGQQATLRGGDIVDLVGVKMVFRLPTEPPRNNTADIAQFASNDLEQMLSGLATPKHTHKQFYQLATPINSSPIREGFGSPSPQVTPTARMRHKMLKYEVGPSSTRNVFNSPPASDPVTDFDFSPVRSKPLFTLPLDAVPTQKMMDMPAPKDESNIFLTEDHPRSTFTQNKSRPPLGSLKVSENKINVNASPNQGASTKKTTFSNINKDKEANKMEAKATTKSGRSENTSQPAKPRTAPRPPKEVLTKPTGTGQKDLPPKDIPSKGKLPKDTTSTLTPKIEAHKPKQEKEVALDDSSSSRDSSPETQKKATVDYTEMIIDTLVFARKKKSMTLTELYEEMIVSQPSLMAEQDPVEIKEQMLQCLSAARCVDKITRKGKDAYNKPLEDQWYYIPERDHNLMRKHTRQEVMPSARKCTLKDKQYFFKMPPKLPYHRKSASPYAVKPSRRKETIKDDGKDSSSDQDDEEDEPTSRKRKLVNSASVDKKRKPAPVQVHNDDDDDDDLQDSLDDLSELSGLSD